MEDALSREEARQLEAALAASLADQGTPSPQQTLQPSSWGNVTGTPPLVQPSSSNRTPPNVTPLASGTIGGPGGLAYIPGFGNILDPGPPFAAKPSSNPAPNLSPKLEAGAVGVNGFGLTQNGLTQNGPEFPGGIAGVSSGEAVVSVGGSGFENEGLASRQRRAGVNGVQAMSPLGEGVSHGLANSQDESDRELALKLAAEENRPGPPKSDEDGDHLLALRLQDEENRSARNSPQPPPQRPAFLQRIYPPAPVQFSPMSTPPSRPQFPPPMLTPLLRPQFPSPMSTPPARPQFPSPMSAPPVQPQFPATVPSGSSPFPSPFPATAASADEQLARNLQQQLALEDRREAANAAAAGTSGGAPRGDFRLPLGGTLGSAPQIPAPLRSLSQRLRDLGADSPNQTCAHCKQALSGQYLQTSDHAKRYHPECYQRFIVPRCSVCKMSIPADEHGVIQYLKQSFWGDKRCPVHDRDGTAQCSACHRMEPVDVPYVTLDDGRKLCLDCCSSLIVDTADCQPLYREVLEFYETMGMRLPQKDIPLLLVERGALNEAQKKETSEGGKPGVHDAMTTRGLCLSEEQEIRSVVRKPIGRAHLDQGLSHQTEQKVVRRHCEVTAILILFGLPRVLTGSILAHELMHAWLRLDGSFPRLDPVIEEGICQVLAHMWLQTQLPARRQSAQTSADVAAGEGRSSDSDKVGQSDEQVKEKLAEFFLHEIEMNPTAVYGAGFRAGHAAMVKFGLETVLEHMRMTGVFPA